MAKMERKNAMDGMQRECWYVPLCGCKILQFSNLSRNHIKRSNVVYGNCEIFLFASSTVDKSNTEKERKKPQILERHIIHH